MALPLPRSRLTLAVLAVCALLLALGAALLLSQPGRRTGSPSGIGGPFALVDQDGRRVTEADVAGRPYLVFFGYTHCPDICPTTLSDLSRMLDVLGKDKKLTALFVTVDPERDTPAVLKDYLASFDPRIRGLTGDPAAIAAAERTYRVYAKKVPAAGGDYSMDHTSVVYLMDAGGLFVTALNLAQPPEAVAAEVGETL